MPYIKPSQRSEIDDLIAQLAAKIKEIAPSPNTDGVMNYTITTLVHKVYNQTNYKTINNVVGMLECVKQEYYRRVAAPYEDEKIKENGDV